MPRPAKSDFTDIVSGIYDAAVDPAQWPEAMVRLSWCFDAPGYVLAGATEEVTHILPQVIEPSQAQGYRELLRNYPEPQSNPLRDAAIRQGLHPGKVFIQEQLVDAPEWSASEIYQTMFKPNGVETQIVLILATHGSPTLHSHVAFNRPRRDPFNAGECRLLASLYPHFRRAIDIHQRLEGKTLLGRLALEALERLVAGMILVSADGRVIHANAAAEAIFRQCDGLGAAGGMLHAAHPVESARLQRLVREAAAAFNREVPAAGGALALSRPSGKPPWQVIVSPLAPRNPLGVGPRNSAALVMVTDLEAQADAPENTLRALYGLTQAEARVALALAGGDSPAEVAGRLRIAEGTVRTHIRHLHEKLAVRSQAQLMRRLAPLLALRN